MPTTPKCLTKFALLSLTTAVFFSGILRSQTATGSLTGNVRDQSQAAVPGVTITLRNTATNETRTTTSNGLGYYSLQLLPPATYRLEAQMGGFRRFVRENLTLAVGAALGVDVELQVGETSDAVTVADSAPPLESASASLGQVMENKRLVDLPINGRNSYGFAALIPGVRASALFTQVAYASYNDQFLSINGSRTNVSQFYLDGGANSTAGFNGPGIFPSLDLVQEYKVQTNNFSAEFGNTAGGVVNVVTKTGTNQFHGSVYDFVRNDKLEANNFFANQGGLPVAPLRFNQFGFSIGGPVTIPKLYKGTDRTFFFFSYEGLRWVRALTASGTLPTALQRSGDFSRTLNSAGALVNVYDPMTTAADPSRAGQYTRTTFPGNVVPANRMDPVAVTLLKYLPLPTGAGAANTGANNYVSSNSAPTQKDTFSIRVDHSFTNNQKLFFRFSPNNTTVNRPLVYGSQYGPGNPINGIDTLHHRQGTLNYTWVVGPSTVVELSSSVLHYWLGRVSPGLNFDPVQLGLPSYFHNLTPNLCFPSISATGLGVTLSVTDNGGGFIGFGCQNTSQSYDTFHEYGNVTKVHGAHTLKIGASTGSNRWTQRAKPSGGGYPFAADFTQGPNPLVASSTAGVPFASFLLGTGTSGGSISSDQPGQFVSYHYYGAYIQDDWKATSKLTLNIGLRYDYNAPWTEKRNRINSWDGITPVQIAGMSLRGGLIFPGVNGVPRGEYDPDKTNFAPRFGFAYTPDSKTVIRGGFGMFYGPSNGAAFTNSASVASSGFSASTLWVNSVDGVTPTNLLSNPYPGGFQKAPGSSLGLLTLLGQSVSTMDRGRSSLYAEQWNLTFQRVLPLSLSAELAYAGSHGIHLQGPLPYDQLPDQYLAMGDALRTQVPNPFYGLVATGTLAAATVQRAQLLRPFPQFTGVSTINSYGNSIYHSLQAKLERRFTNGFSLLVGYTFSKLLDDVLPSTANAGFAGESFSAGNIQNFYNRRLDRAVASYDTPHNLTINALYELPFGRGKKLANHGGVVNAIVGGWQINGLASMHSGAPIGLTTATSTLNNFGLGQRPNYVGGVDPNGHGPISQRLTAYFNPAAFAVPGLYSYGNTARLLDWLRAPGVGNLDASMFKNFSIRERLRAQFRAEFFNVLNRPQFDFPGTTIGTATAGVISNQANSPRDIQLALKLLF